MTRRRKWLLLAAALAAPLALAAGALAWLTLTQAGLDRVVALAQSLDVVELRIDGARGRLAGPLAIERFELRHERVEVTARGLALDYEPSSLAWGRIGADAFRARQVLVRVKPRQRPDDTPPRFLPRGLDVAVDDIDLPDVTVVMPGGQRLERLRAGGRLRLSATRLALDDAFVAAPGWSAAGVATLTAAAPLALEGSLTQVTAGAGRELRASAVRFGGDLDALAVEADVAAPAAARVAGRLLDLAGSPRWEARAELRAWELPLLQPAGIRGPLSGALSGRGGFTRFAVAGRVAAEGLPAPGADLAADLRLEADAVAVERWTLALPARGLAAEGRARVGYASPQPLALEVRWRDLAWPLAAATAQLRSSRGELTLAGTGSYQWRLAAELAPAGLPPFSAEGEGRIDAAALEVRRATLAGLGGRGTLAGSLGFGADRPWRFRLAVRDLDPGRLRPDLSGRLSARLEGRGTGLDAGARWQATLADLSGTFRRQPVAGRGDVTHRPGLTQFDRTRLSVGPARLELEGRIGADTDLVARLRADDLSRLLPELAGSVRGELFARADGVARPRGRPWVLAGTRVQLSLTGTDLRYGEYRAARLGAEADVDLGDAQPSWVRVRTIGVDLAGRRLQPTRLSLDGRARAHALVLRTGIGADALELVGEGSLDWPRYALRVTALEGQGPNVPDYALAGPFELRAGPGGAELTPMCFSRQAARACVEGRWSRREPWLATLSGEGLPLGVLGLELPGRPAYRGRLDLQLAVGGAPGEPWSAAGVATIGDATFSYRRPSGREETIGLGATRVDVASTPDRWLLRAASRATADTFVEAEAWAPRGSGGGLASLPLAGSVRAHTRELGLLPLFVPELDRAAGELRAELELGGTVGAPQFAGSVALERGELDFYQTNLRLTAVAADLAFRDQSLALSAAARAGAGTLTADGTLSWRERELAGQLALRGERLLVANLPEARVLASPDLRFRFGGGRAVVEGKVLVPEARIAPATITGAVLPSGDERRVDDAEAAAGRGGTALEARLTLTLGEKVSIDAFGLKGRLTGSLAAQASGDDVPTGTGEFKVEDGEYSAYTRELEVSRGRLLFAGGPLTDPGVDLRAERRFPGYVAGINVRGRLRKPELSFFSDPPLSQSEIASLILVGRRLDTLGGGDSGQLALNRDQLATQGGALLAGQLGRYVGLDAVELETGANDDAALVLGKFLSPRLYVSYGISLAQQINTLKLRYTIGDRWLVNLESGAASSVDVEFTVDR